MSETSASGIFPRKTKPNPENFRSKPPNQKKINTRRNLNTVAQGTRRASSLKKEERERVKPESVSRGESGSARVGGPDLVDDSLAQAQSDPSTLRIGGHTMINQTREKEEEKKKMAVEGGR